MRWTLMGIALALASFTASAQTALTDTSGPYAAVMEMDRGMPDHTVYRPADLSAVVDALPEVSFGNGGCINIGSMYQTLLGEIASHGYLVVASGPIVTEPADPQRNESSRRPSR